MLKVTLLNGGMIVRLLQCL